MEHLIRCELEVHKNSEVNSSKSSNSLSFSGQYTIKSSEYDIMAPSNLGGVIKLKKHPQSSHTGGN